MPPLFTFETCCISNESEFCWTDGYTFESCCSRNSNILNEFTPVVENVGEPICWMNGFSYEECCNEEPRGNPLCWSGIFTFGRCCKNVHRTSNDCLLSIQALTYLEEVNRYLLTNVTSPEMLDSFNHVGHYWPCEEALALALVQTIEASPLIAQNDVEAYLDIVESLFGRILGRDELLFISAQYLQVISKYIKKVQVVRERIDKIEFGEMLDIVLPYCGEDMGWFFERFDGQAYQSEVMTNLVDLYIYNKCPHKDASAFKDFVIKAETLFHRVYVKHVWEILMGSECTGYLNHLSHAAHESQSQWTLFIHPDSIEHIGNADMFFETILMAAESVLSALTDDLNFLSLSINYIEPFWAVYHEYSPVFKRLYTKVFNLSSQGLAPDASETSLYCCSQFIVKTSAIRLRNKPFYKRIYDIINDPVTVSDVIGFPGHQITNRDVKQRLICELMMPMWHVMFGEVPKAPSRQNDPRVPLYYKQRNVSIQFFKESFPFSRK